MRELMLQTQVLSNLPAVRKTEGMPMIRETTEPAEVEAAIKKKIDELKSMGFVAAAKKAESAHKMSVAYGKFMFISEATIEKFNQRLKKETLEEDKRAYHYKKLVFIPIEKYKSIPPSHVMEALGKAKQLNLFDHFEVGKIDWIEEIKDPIVFGVIEGCTDKFYIAQWDSDISIEELLSV